MAEIIDDEFSDLRKQIGVENWLIPTKEISTKRFVKRTTRHNIYKADWFGDVLVYEPRNGLNDRKKTDKFMTPQQHKKSKLPLPISNNITKTTTNNQRFDTQELSIKLDSLRIKTPTTNSQLSPCRSSSGRLKSRSQHSLLSPNSMNESSIDSAYSSISSTPIYNTKTNLRTEFEFPSSQMSSPNFRHEANSDSVTIQTPTKLEKSINTHSQCNTFFCDFPMEQKHHQHHNHQDHELFIDSSDHKDTTSKHNLNTANDNYVILNKDSYTCGGCSQTLCTTRGSCISPELEIDGSFHQGEEPKKYNDSLLHQHGSSTSSFEKNSKWTELNELRLIAHENFMLFMGASSSANYHQAGMAKFCEKEDQFSSLVIQMNHPRAISLNNLLRGAVQATSNSVHSVPDR